MEGLRLIKDNVESDQFDIEKYVKELANVCEDMLRATCAMFEQEHFCFINMFVVTGTAGGAGGGRVKLANGVMQHSAIQNLKAASGDKSLVSIKSSPLYWKLGSTWARSWTWR